MGILFVADTIGMCIALQISNSFGQKPERVNHDMQIPRQTLTQGHFIVSEKPPTDCIIITILNVIYVALYVKVRRYSE